jgi:diamine N-acetyltransferase
MIVRDAMPADGTALSALGGRVFVETFGHLYRPEDLNAFLAQSYGPDGLAAKIGHPEFQVRVALDGEVPIGFARLGPVDFPGDWPEAVELYQLYVDGQWHGRGVAAALMEWAIETARAAGHRRLVLSVYVDNHRARRFYARYGFVEVGRYGFPVGDQIDDDRIMALDL